jgi:hypothetical protein
MTREQALPATQTETYLAERSIDDMPSTARLVGRTRPVTRKGAPRHGPLLMRPV